MKVEGNLERALAYTGEDAIKGHSKSLLMLSVDRADTSNMSQLYDSGFSHTSVEIDFLK